MVTLRFAVFFAACATAIGMSACNQRQQAGTEPSEVGLNGFIQRLERNPTRMHYPGGEIAPVVVIVNGDAVLFHCGMNGQTEAAAVQDCRRAQPIGQLRAPYTDGNKMLCRMTAREMVPGVAQKSAICVASEPLQIRSTIGKEARAALLIPPRIPFYVLDVFEIARRSDMSDIRFYFFSKEDARAVRVKPLAHPQPVLEGSGAVADVADADGESDCEDMAAKLQEAKLRQQAAFGPDLPVAIQDEVSIALRMDSMGCSTSGTVDTPAPAIAAGASAAGDAADAAIEVADAAQAAADAAEAAAAAAQYASSPLPSSRGSGQDTGSVPAATSEVRNDQESAAEQPTDTQAASLAGRSLDTQFRERANEDCPRGFLGKACRQQIRETLCAGKWNSEPQPGETECRR